ncbi:MAG TPA: NAD-dependent epimerase/dehydratase family protein [Planctomycetaceae bacterium]|nr:NAD-dependent epimerase/dehydratase family protein [Planctomycetaceae bacterium]
MNDLLLVTGATGLVGSHVAEEARRRGVRTRALVRSGADAELLRSWGVELAPGDMTDAASLNAAASGATVIVHCAAKVGDWGPVEAYREINVRGLEKLLDAAEAAGTLRRFVHISSLGVYEARDHHGTDETEPPAARGIDGYTLTKVEAEQLVLKHAAEQGLPAVVLRPGFIYGPRDRTVLPRLLERLRRGQVKFLGSGEQLMNNTYVGNLVQAVFQAIERDEAAGQVYNITDGRLVSKREFITTIAGLAGYPPPTSAVPLGLARVLARGMEGLWKLLGKQEAPLLSNARIKFLGLNLDFAIGKARRELAYDPQVDFTEAMAQTVQWFREQGLAGSRAEDRPPPVPPGRALIHPRRPQ